MGSVGEVGGVVTLVLTIVVVVTVSIATFTTRKTAGNALAMGMGSKRALTGRAIGVCGLFSVAIDNSGCNCGMGDLCAPVLSRILNSNFASGASRKCCSTIGGTASAGGKAGARGFTGSFAGRLLGCGGRRPSRVVGRADAGSFNGSTASAAFGISKLSFNCCLIYRANAGRVRSSLIPMIKTATAIGLGARTPSVAGATSGSTAAICMKRAMACAVAKRIPSVANCDGCMCGVRSALASNLSFIGGRTKGIIMAIGVKRATCSSMMNMVSGSGTEGVAVSLSRGIGATSAKTRVGIACRTGMGGGTVIRAGGDTALRCDGGPNARRAKAAGPSRIMAPACPLSMGGASAGSAVLTKTRFGLCTLAASNGVSGGGMVGMAGSMRGASNGCACTTGRDTRSTVSRVMAITGGVSRRKCGLRVGNLTTKVCCLRRARTPSNCGGLSTPVGIAVAGAKSAR